VIAAAIPAVAAFALANRFAGGGLGWGTLSKDHGGPLGGRPLWYATVWLAAIVVTLLGVEALWVVAAWHLWRTPGWYGAIDMGRDQHSFGRDWAYMGLRVLMPPGLIAAAVWTLELPVAAAAIAAMFVGVPSLYALGWAIGGRDPVRTAEYLTGALWGAFAVLCVKL